MRLDPTRAREVGRELQLHASLSYFHGKTMLPFLQEGDQVAVLPVTWHDIRIGDVLTYRHEDKFPTRRVMRRRAQHVVLRADSMAGRPVFVVPREDVLGRAVARQRDGRWLYRHQWSWRWAAVRAVASHYLAHAWWLLGR
jgi:hypothetical protein